MSRSWTYLVELQAHFQSVAFIEESTQASSANGTSRGSTADGSSKAKAIVVNNVKNGKARGGKKVDKAKSKA